MKNKNIDLLIILLIILISIYIIKLLKLMGICCMILSILSPLFFGYTISWILRPVVNKIRFNRTIATLLIYLLFIGIVVFSILKIVPLLFLETKKVIPIVRYYVIHNKYLLKVYNNINIKRIFINNIKYMNSCLNNILGVSINIIYSLIFGFLFLITKESKNYFKFIPKKLKRSINKYLILYIKSIILDTLFMLIILSICFSVEGLSNPLFFAFFASITNIIPYIGPYIGGLPAILIGLSKSINLGIIITITIIIVQSLENNIIQPIIVSKNVNLNPISILISIIIFSHFFGIIGMILATPITIIIKCVIIYYKKNKPKWFNLILDKL